MKNHGTPFTNGQCATITGRVVTALPKAFEKSGLDAKTILSYTSEGQKLSLALAEAFRMLHRGDLKVTTPPQKSLLGYWKHGLRLYIEENFFDRVFTCAKESDTADISSCDFIELVHRMSDQEIIKTCLGGMASAKKNAFTLNQIAAFIERQRKGEEESLLSNSSSNLFYVLGTANELFVVCVSWKWFASGHRWSVDACRLGQEVWWEEGYRVFRNN
jgi:hypothetical protein